MRELYINGIRLNEYMDILSVSESILPPLSTHTVQVPGKPGSLFLRQVVDKKVIKVMFNIRAESFEERSGIIDEINPILFTGKELVVTLPNGRRYKAVVDGETDLANALFDGYGDFTLVAIDPISYGDTITEELQAHGQYFYAGTFETRGVFTIFSRDTEQVRIQILSESSSEHDFIEINDNFISGDTIIIDMEKETVVKNGLLIMDKVNWAGDFFDIKSGYYNLLFRGGDGYFTYEERWS